MEKLKYTVEDSTIAALLGVQNYTNKESAVLELVKNSYDAGATQLTITITKDSVTIRDNGIGMAATDIKNKWMHVGKSEKKYKVPDINNIPRIASGSKGIGRFALARLGEHAIVCSLHLDAEAVKWETDWNYSTLIEGNFLKTHGTDIAISGLRDRWTRRAVKNLSVYLSKAYNDDKMNIVINSEDGQYPINKFFKEQVLGVNCKAIINFKFDATNHLLETNIRSDEFTEDAQKLIQDIDINKYESVINVFDEFRSGDWDLTEQELLEHLQTIGTYSGVLYFNFSATKSEQEKFFYKYNSVSTPIESGVILYRNAFSISAYEGRKDWLALGKRARKSPAAATHPTGAWRVRENQLAGQINIDKERNAIIRDLSNRQGLEESQHYDLFVAIIQLSIKEFERYRQSIIRKISEKSGFNKQGSEEKPIADSIIKSYKAGLNLSLESAKKLSDEIKSFKRENTGLLREIKDTEQRYKYDVGILNVLATIGLKASSQAHEIRNDRNFIATVNDNIVAALKRYDIWEYLCEPERIDKSYRNIPQLLEKSSKTDKKLLGFMDTILQEIEKKQFQPKWQELKEILELEKRIWEKDYGWLKIRYTVDDGDSFYCSEDVIRVILDNLILNSIQQNNVESSLLISIDAKLRDDILLIHYSDNGKGLDPKYRVNPKKILEVHETTRKNGHGLGMWIVNNTINMHGGKVINIGTDKGFVFDFSLKGDMQ